MTKVGPDDPTPDAVRSDDDITPVDRPGPLHPKIVAELLDLSKEVASVARHLEQTSKKIAAGTLHWDQKVRQELESELRKTASTIFNTAFDLPRS